MFESTVTVLFSAAQTAAQAAHPPSGSGGPQLNSLLFMIVAMFGIMYFFMIRPQQKRERERREMLSSLSKGDKVVTSGGICGTVVGLSEDRVILKVAENVTIEFLRGAVAQVISKEKESKKN